MAACHYQRGIKITDKEMNAFEARYLHRHEFHGKWNYTMCATRRPVVSPIE
ncbi:MAG: hypothetical protein M3Z25_07410 [Actinomycetota bacterium]|nr:hypothetical protein [Actinomycetota bacterium]